MNTFAKLAIFAAAPLALAACDSPQEDAAEATGDAIEQNAEVQADAMEDNADAVRAADPGMNSDATEARADAMENSADATRDRADATADKMEDAAERGAPAPVTK